MKHLLIILVLLGSQITGGVASSLQRNDCGNGILQQFSNDDIGRAITDNLSLYNEPDGQVLDHIRSGSFLRIIGGPACASGGVSWWEIQLGAGAAPYSSGWVPETIGRTYQISRLDIPEHNFQTAVHLDAPVRVVDSQQQLAYTGLFGGGNPDVVCPSSESHFFDGPHWVTFDHPLTGGSIIVNQFSAGELVDITVVRPDGSVAFQISERVVHEEICNTNQLSLMSVARLKLAPTDPLGKWQLRFVGQRGTHITHTVYRIQHITPTLVSSCFNNDNYLALDGFPPRENLTITLAEESGRNDPFYVNLAPRTVSVSTWKVQVDDYGQLLVYFHPSIIRSDVRRFFVSDANGGLWGYFSNEPGRGFVGGIARFSPCTPPISDPAASETEVTVPYIGKHSILPDRSSSVSFQANTGDILDIKLEGLEIGVDPQISLRNPLGQLVASNDNAVDASTVNDLSDSYIKGYVVNQPGTYRVDLSAVTGFSEAKLSIIRVNDEIPALSLHGISTRRPINRDEARTYESIWDYTSFQDSREPSTQNYHIVVPRNQPLLMTFTWCADTSARLSQILAPLNVTFSIDGIPLNGSSLLVSRTRTCQIWDTLIENWFEKAPFNLEIRYDLSEPIFDGYANYSNGSYVHRIEINNR